jgi:drug/metabolite transporter (DMT)-like permease
MSRLSATLLLLLSTVIWGFTFVVQKWAATGPQSLDALSFTGLRFLVGTLVVTPFMLRERRASAQPLAPMAWLAFAGCGLLLLTGSCLQQRGMAETSVSNAGFFTGIYVALVPFLSWWLFRNRPHAVIWPALAAMIAGIWLLNGSTLTRFGSGDVWVLASTLFWALHVTVVGPLAAKWRSALTLAWTQFLVAGILGTGAAVVVQHPQLTAIGGVWKELLWAGGVSVGIAFTLQVVAQRYVQPAVAAIVLGSEIVFTALAGALFLGERLTALQLSGGALIACAIFAVEALPQLSFRVSPGIGR